MALHYSISKPNATHKHILSILHQKTQKHQFGSLSWLGHQLKDARKLLIIINDI